MSGVLFVERANCEWYDVMGLRDTCRLSNIASRVVYKIGYEKMGKHILYIHDYLYSTDRNLPHFSLSVLASDAFDTVLNLEAFVWDW